MAPDYSNELPSVGETFAFQLSDGRYSVCRILRKERYFGDKTLVLVACSQWIGNNIPSVDDPSIRPILHLTHHSHFGRSLTIWIAAPPPSELISIGTIIPTDSEKKLSSSSFGFWDAITAQPLMQWLWDHDREAILQADEILKAQKKLQKIEEDRRREEYLVTVTLSDLRVTKFFTNWEQSVSENEINASRQIISQTIEQLLVLRETSIESRLQILRDCIFAFNTLEEKSSFIYSNERDDIYEVLEAVAAAATIADFLDDIFDLGNW